MSASTTLSGHRFGRQLCKPCPNKLPASQLASITKQKGGMNMSHVCWGPQVVAPECGGVVLRAALGHPICRGRVLFTRQSWHNATPTHALSSLTHIGAVDEHSRHVSTCICTTRGALPNLIRCCAQPFRVSSMTQTTGPL